MNSKFVGAIPDPQGVAWWGFEKKWDQRCVGCARGHHETRQGPCQRVDSSGKLPSIMKPQSYAQTFALLKSMEKMLLGDMLESLNHSQHWE